MPFLSFFTYLSCSTHCHQDLSLDGHSWYRKSYLGLVSDSCCLFEWLLGRLIVRWGSTSRVAVVQGRVRCFNQTTGSGIRLRIGSHGTAAILYLGKGRVSWHVYWGHLSSKSVRSTHLKSTKNKDASTPKDKWLRNHSALSSLIWASASVPLQWMGPVGRYWWSLVAFRKVVRRFHQNPLNHWQG